MKNQVKPIPRVRGGVPWWLWLMAGVATLAVIAGILSTGTKEAPGEVFARAVAAAERGDGEALSAELAELRTREHQDDRVTTLEAIIASATGRAPKALKLLEPLLDHEDARIQELALRYSANCAQLTGAAVRARDLYLKVISLDPSNPLPHQQLAALYESVGAFQPAFEAIEKVAELDPQDRIAPVTLARLHIKQGQLDAALEIYESLLDTEAERVSVPPNAVLRYLDCLIRTDRADEALEFFEDNPALVDDPGTQFAILMKNGNLARAEEMLQSMGFDNPGTSAIMIIRAQEAIAAGNCEQATRILLQAIARGPRDRSLVELLKTAASKNNMSDLVEFAAANLQAFDELLDQYRLAVLNIGSDITNADLRLEAARLSWELGNLVQGREWTRSAAQVDPDLLASISTSLNDFQFVIGPLVPFPLAPDEANTVDSTDSDSSNIEVGTSGESYDSPAAAGDHHVDESAAATDTAVPEDQLPTTPRQIDRD